MKVGLYGQYLAQDEWEICFCAYLQNLFCVLNKDKNFCNMQIH